MYKPCKGLYTICVEKQTNLILGLSFILDTLVKEQVLPRTSELKYALTMVFIKSHLL